MSLLEEVFAEDGHVDAWHVAVAVFEIAEKYGLDIESLPNGIALRRRDQPIKTLDSVQEWLRDALFDRHTEVLLAGRSGDSLLSVLTGVNRHLASPRFKLNTRAQRARERELRAVGGALSWCLWTHDGTTAAEMQPVCRRWVAEVRSRPEWWIAPGKWPGEHGNLLTLCYGVLVRSFD